MQFIKNRLLRLDANFDIAIWIMTICSVVDTATSLVEKFI
jgi:hypothetical protein